MVQGADKLKPATIAWYSRRLGVTPRSIYRYLDKIAEAKDYIKDVVADSYAEKYNSPGQVL